MHCVKEYQDAYALCYRLFSIFHSSIPYSCVMYIKMFFKDFLGTTATRIFKTGINVYQDLLYFVRENQPHPT